VHEPDQVLVGGGQDPDISCNGTVVAHPFELFFLQDPEQLGLCGEGQIAYFIQKNDAVVGRLKAADPCPVGTGEGPLDMAEELTFQEIFIEGRSVDFDKGPVMTGAQTVDGGRSQFLSRAGPAIDNHRCFRRGGAGDEIKNLFHDR